MGYACPVCETPQADAEHLANHLAFTAMLGREDHETWLDDHAPGWDEDDPETLGDRVAEHAEAAEYNEVFEDTTHDHDHGGATFEEELERQVGGGRSGAGRGDLTGDAQEALAEARAMTERMYAEEDADGETSNDDGEGKE
ncbi:DUF5810 domain-containing protein [Halostella pelagica]|uniref:DUF5810 domain-containing protein n=1 Tax=Halostella pelagica TaxID=2583824 RepID=UPI0010818FCB|nr:DUF5810 domain-containing protein [Halostella pelagica]